MSDEALDLGRGDAAETMEVVARLEQGALLWRGDGVDGSHHHERGR
jgi:hypothetical protein